jgi:hypothetical protein
LNLTTHAALGFVLGIALFRNVEIAIVMMIGAFIPDLDREHLFIARKKWAELQLHRALFHNFFFLGGLYLFNPYLAIGAFTHVMLDMGTTATDRGAEVLFPVTRVVRGFLWDIEAKTQKKDRKLKWWVEDPWRLLKKTSDRDLSEPEDQPWGRFYGPFKNSRIVDWGIFFGSIIFLLLLYATNQTAFFSSAGLSSYTLISLFGVFIFYGLGEWWRRKLSKKYSASNVRWLVLTILIIGLVIFLLGSIYLYSPVQISTAIIGAVVINGVIAGILGLMFAYLFVRFRDKHTITA